MNKNKLLNMGLRVVISLVIASAVILIMGDSPFYVFFQIIKGAFGSAFNFGGMLEKFVPLTLTAVAFAVSTKAGASNVGVEGELYLGAITAAYLGYTLVGLSKTVHIVVVIGAAMLIGALWAGIAGALKAYLGVNEVCTTIMMNYVAKSLCSYLVNYPLSAKVGVPQTPVMEETARLSVILPPSRANTGLFITFFVVIAVYLFFQNTAAGYRIRCTGNNPQFSRYVGIDHRANVFYAMLLSGAVGGLAGAIEVTGIYGYFLDNFSINTAFDGMLVSLISKNKILTIPFAALMIAIMKAGALSLNRYTDMSKAFVDTILALFIVLCCIDNLFEHGKNEIPFKNLDRKEKRLKKGACKVIFDLSFLQATFRATTPILLAGLAAVITQQAGILNVGVEGIMLMAAFTAVYVSYTTGSWLLAVLAAVIFGVIIAAIIGIVHIKYKADIFAIGMAVNTLILALTKLLLEDLLGSTGSFYSSEIVQIPRVNFAGAGSGSTDFGNFALMDILSWIGVVLVWFLIYKTIWGLRLRSVGFFSAASDSAGLNSNRIKMVAILLSGVIGGLAGAHLSLGYSAMFVENMVNGRGFMGVAAMLFGAGNPIYTCIGCFIFGAADSLGARLQTQGWPSQFMQMVPYLVTVGVLTVAALRNKFIIRRRENE